jgi:hypothetical protein
MRESGDGLGASRTPREDMMGSKGRPPTKQRQSEELLLRPPTKAGVWTERGAAAWWALDEERHRSALEAEERKALQMNLSEALSKALDEAQQRGVRVLWHGSVQPVASPQNGSKEPRATGLNPSTAPETGPRSTPNRAGPNGRTSWLDGWFHPWSEEAAKVAAQMAAGGEKGGEGQSESTAEERGGGLLRYLSDISSDSSASHEMSPESSPAARAVTGTGHRSDTSPTRIRRRAKSRTRLTNLTNRLFPNEGSSHQGSSHQVTNRLFPNDAAANNMTAATAGLSSPVMMSAVPGMRSAAPGMWSAAPGTMRSAPLALSNALPAAAAVPAAQATSASSTTSTIKTSNVIKKVSADAKAAALTAARGAEMTKFYATAATMPKPSPADETLLTLEEVIFEQLAFMDLPELAGDCA